MWRKVTQLRNCGVPCMGVSRNATTVSHVNAVLVCSGDYDGRSLPFLPVDISQPPPGYLPPAPFMAVPPPMGVPPPHLEQGAVLADNSYYVHSFLLFEQLNNVSLT